MTNKCTKQLHTDNELRQNSVSKKNQEEKLINKEGNHNDTLVSFYRFGAAVMDVVTT